MRAMRLYHFTSHHHLPEIIGTGVLRPTESNIGSPNPEYPPVGEHVGPDVVWTFTRSTPRVDDPRMLNGHAPTFHDKRLVRIAIEVPDAVRFVPWAKQLGIHPQWLKELLHRQSPNDWRIVVREIRKDEWVKIEKREAVGSKWEEVKGW